MELKQKLTREQVIEKYKLDRDLSSLDLSGIDLSGLNLSEANLEGANLTGANLRWANLENIIGKTILTFSAGKHFAYYVDGLLNIGCESHTLIEWLNIYQDLAKEYEYSDEQINYYLDFINICKRKANQ